MVYTFYMIKTGDFLFNVHLIKARADQLMASGYISRNDPFQIFRYAMPFFSSVKWHLQNKANPISMIILIMIPLSTPIIAVLTLWTAIGHWNAWFDCLLYINDRNKMVLQIMLQRLLFSKQDVGDSWDSFDQNLQYIPATLEASMIIVTLGPIILMYPFLQKYFVKGIFIGSLKG